jgi:predicted  nucleic acid-binding Zn-ribbon protein
MARWGKPIKNKKRRDPRYFLNEADADDERIDVAMQQGKAGGNLNQYHDLARHALTARESTKSANAKISVLIDPQHPISKEIMSIQDEIARMARGGMPTQILKSKMAKLQNKLKQEKAKIQTGGHRALFDLELAAKKDPDAQAILDAVYKEKPILKPRAQAALTPAERQNMQYID